MRHMPRPRARGCYWVSVRAMARACHCACLPVAKAGIMPGNLSVPAPALRRRRDNGPGMHGLPGLGDVMHLMQRHRGIASE